MPPEPVVAFEFEIIGFSVNLSTLSPVPPMKNAPPLIFASLEEIEVVVT